MPSYADRLDAARAWIDNPRFEGITRLYAAREIAEQQGTIDQDYTVAREAADGFYARLRELFASRQQITTFGPYSPGQAVVLKRLGIEGIYLGGWATSAKGSVSEDPGADLASYPLSQVPDEAAPIVRALLTADRNQAFARTRMKRSQREKTPQIDYRPFIIADADTGHGGDAHVRNLIRRFVEAGVPGYHIEDQKPGVKKCGHQGGKVLVPQDEQIKRLNAARLQLDVMRVAGIIVARTDAESATFIESRADERDQPFILGATSVDLPSYKAGFVAILQQLHERGLDAIRGHLLFSMSRSEHERALAWLERAGLLSVIEQAATSYDPEGDVTLDSAIDPVFDRYLDAWQAQAGLKTYGQAIALNRPGLPLEEALVEYREERHLEVLKLQNSARNSTEWFETLERYLHFEPIQFAYSLLTRSQRVSHENLRLRDPQWLEDVERWFEGRARGAPVNDPAPPMFAPFRLRELELANRVVVSPMAMYSATDGTPGDFHLVHYGARAQGGAGLVYTEMTCVSEEGRITPGCAGMYRAEHAEAWRRIVDFVHAHSGAKFCLQLGHSGPKGSTKVGWEGYDVPLESGNWPVMAASDVAWSPANQVPRPMTRADMDWVREQFVAAVRMGIEAGFDMIELHAAHGYLLSSFITPLHNKRTDEYGGSLENRLRFPLAVFAAMREAWPSDRPMSVRISANDWMGDLGVTPAEAVEIGRAFAEAGADLIDVSAGQTWAECKPIYGRMFQTPFADRIRNEGRLTTMAVGNIFETDHVNSILAAGRADLVALGRPHLADPMWTARAAAAHHHHGLDLPRQYRGGFDQLERNLQRASEQEAALRA